MAKKKKIVVGVKYPTISISSVHKTTQTQSYGPKLLQIILKFEKAFGQPGRHTVK